MNTSDVTTGPMRNGAGRRAHPLVDLLPTSVEEPTLCLMNTQASESGIMFDGLPEGKHRRVPHLEKIVLAGEVVLDDEMKLACATVGT